MLADGVAAYQDCLDKQVQFLSNLAPQESPTRYYRWEHQYEFRSGKWVHTDYNFQKPTTNIQADTKGKLPLAESNKWEFFDYPGEYEEKGDGKAEQYVWMKKRNFFFFFFFKKQKQNESQAVFDRHPPANDVADPRRPYRLVQEQQPGKAKAI